MALSGNWGKSGTGFNCFLVPIEHVGLLMTLERPAAQGGLLGMLFERERTRYRDREITDARPRSRCPTDEAARAATWLSPRSYGAWAPVERPECEADLWRVSARTVERGWWDKQQARPGPASRRALMLMAHIPCDANAADAAFMSKSYPEADMIFAVETDVVVGRVRRHRCQRRGILEKDDTTITFGMNRCYGADRAGRRRVAKRSRRGDLRRAGERRARTGTRPESFADA